VETGRTPSFALVPTLGLAAVAAGCAFGSRAARAAGTAAVGLTGLMLADQARSPTVPGASDNATGVAALLALAEWIAADPPEDVETVVLIPGCEESGMGGMRAWLDADGRALDPALTLVLGLDTLGSGEPRVLSGEGGVRTVRYREEDVAWADLGAERAGLGRPPRWRIGGWTDPILALYAGLPAISIVSARDGGFANYHLPTDTPENVDWGSVERCLRLAAGTIEAWVGETDEEVGSAA
jgi:Zn-dependent M28 family amino/carboxypeptidase